MSMRSVTAEDVARHVGVSRSTVSRAFSSEQLVKQATRKKILRAAQKLGYQPNAFAQALTSQRSQIVGIVMGELGNPFHALLHSALVSRLQSSGIIPITAQLGSENSIDDAVATFRRYQVGAVLLTSMEVTQYMISTCRNAGLPVALLNRVDEENLAASVCGDLEEGGAIAAEHVAARGRSRIAVVQGLQGSWTTRARLAGHLAGLARAGKEPLCVLPGNYTYEAGVVAAEKLFSGGTQPDAVLCANDLTAIGLMDVARLKFGLRIPDDLAVIGFDDIPMGGWKCFNLSTVRLPVNRMIDRIIDLLVQMMAESAQISEKTLITCRLIVRGTT